MPTFAENLKQARLNRFCTQDDMSRMLGMTTRGYRNYELGAREPNLSDLVKIADFLNVSLDDLVGREFPAKDPLVDSE